MGGGPNPQMMNMMGMMGKGGPGGMPGGGPGMMGMMGKGGPMPGQMPMGMMGKGGPMPGQMPMGGMKGGAPAQGQPMPQQQQGPAQNTGGQAPLNASTLAAAPPSVQKQMIGEKIFPAISKFQPELAGKITGMMLEMDNSELLMLLESESQLKGKVDEAMRVLESQRT